MTPDQEVAWAGGLFEGEGCITLSAGHARMKLNSTDEDVVRRFHRIVGVGQVRVDHAPNRRGWKTQWEWYTGKRASVEAVAAMLLPFLGERRQQRATEVLG